MHLLVALDQAVFFDGFDIVNSACCECIARRFIAIEPTYGSGRAFSSKSFDFFSLYDIASIPRVARVPAADRAVQGQLAFEASMDKLTRQAKRDCNAEDLC